MGLGPSKEKIHNLLYHAMEADQIEKTKIIPYLGQSQRKESHPLSMELENGSSFISEKSADCDKSNYYERSFPANISIYPFCAIGILSVRFPNMLQLEKSTATMIASNVAVTLSSNLFNDDLGGLASEVLFNNQKVNKDNIYINPNYVQTRKNCDNYAMISFSNDIIDSWMGVEVTTEEELYCKDLNIYGWTNVMNGKDLASELRGMGIRIYSAEDNCLQYNVELSSGQEGAPIFYKDEDGGCIIVGLHTYESNESKEGYGIKITNLSFDFFKKGMAKANNLKRQSSKKINEDKVIQLNLCGHDFGPLDVKYLIEFNLINLTLLDLSSNSIQPQGAFYLSQGRYPNLAILNLSFNEIGDEGVEHLSKASFRSLSQLYLFHNNIGKNGVMSLCSSGLTTRLEVLSLSENEDIQDEGCRIFSQSKRFPLLNTLNLNKAGITDKGVKFIRAAYMPSLKKIQLTNNLLTKEVDDEIISWKQSGMEIAIEKSSSRKGTRSTTL